MNTTWALVKLASLSRIFTLILMIACDYLIPDHNATGVLRYDVDPSLLKTFTKWDAAWFLNLAKNGYPFPSWREKNVTNSIYSDLDSFEEQSHAFFPLFPWVIRLIAVIIEKLFSFDRAYIIIFSAVTLSNIAFLASSVALLQLSNQLQFDRKRAYWTVVAYCINPASVFFSTCYTESIFAFFSFSGFALFIHAGRCCHGDRRNIFQWWAAFLLFAATFTRSNGLLNLLIFGLGKLFLLAKRFCNISLSHMTLSLVTTALQLIFIASPYLFIQLYAYYKFCDFGESPELEIYPWCLHKFPSIYSWVQEQYWNVGFLRYYSWRNVPNFLLAFPVILVSIFGIKFQLTALFTGSKHDVLLENFRSTKISAVLVGTSLGSNLSFRIFMRGVFALHWTFLLVFSILAANIQVTTRLLAAACPPIHWYIGYILSGDDGILAQKWMIIWVLSYGFIGPLTHSNFFPWT